MLIGFGDGYVAGFAALRAVITPVNSQPDVMLRLAIAAVFLAGALRFGLVALGAEDDCIHADGLLCTSALVDGKLPAYLPQAYLNGRC